MSKRANKTKVNTISNLERITKVGSLGSASAFYEIQTRIMQHIFTFIFFIILWVLIEHAIVNEIYLFNTTPTEEIQ